MGTNYYWYRAETNKCEHYGRSDKSEPVHIGKSSSGWCFSLHVSSDSQFPPSTFDDWKDLFYWEDSYIEDEYGHKVSAEIMISIITERKHKDRGDSFDYERNHAEPGPNNLVRYKIDGSHCIGHGDGTWDYITGDFS